MDLDYYRNIQSTLYKRTPLENGHLVKMDTLRKSLLAPLGNAVCSCSIRRTYLHSSNCEMINVHYFQQSLSVQTVSIKMHRVVVRVNELLMFAIK